MCRLGQGILTEGGQKMVLSIRSVTFSGGTPLEKEGCAGGLGPQAQESNVQKGALLKGILLRSGEGFQTVSKGHLSKGHLFANL